MLKFVREKRPQTCLPEDEEGNFPSPPEEVDTTHLDHAVPMTDFSPGGKKFSRDLQPLDSEGNQMGMWREPGEKPASSDEEDDDSSEEESSDGGEGSSAVPKTGDDVSREQRKELARKKKLQAIAKKNQKVAAPGDLPSSSEEEEEEDEDDMPANPNHTQKARSQARAAVVPSSEAPAPKKADGENLSRREREALAAQQARERYQKLHAEGKTDEARADMARLKLIREQREQATARKVAEKEERDDREKERDARETKLREAAMGGGAKPAKKGKK